VDLRRDIDSMDKTEHIFIVGNSRSGTTLMATILSMHSKIHILNETHFYDEYIEKANRKLHIDREYLINRMLSIEEFGIYRKNVIKEYPDMVSRVSLMTSDSKNGLFPVIISVFKEIARKHHKTISGDQTPRNVYHLSDILKKFPHSKAIIMIRDSRDVVLSQKNKWKVANDIIPKYESIRARLNYHPVTTSLIWNQGIKTSLKYRSESFSNNVKFVKYDELVFDPDRMLNDICTFLDVSCESGMKDVSLIGSSNMLDQNRKLKGILPSAVGKWKILLNQTESYICQTLTEKYLKYFNFKIETITPNYFVLLLYLVTFLPQLSLALLCNLNRIGNPLKFISERIRITFTKI